MGSANKPLQDKFKSKSGWERATCILSKALIAPNTCLGLEEVEAVRSTRDFFEVGVFNPSIRSIIAYNTDSQIIPTVRSNGIPLAQIVPQGGTISGRSSLVYTEADNWEDALVSNDNLIFTLAHKSLCLWLVGTKRWFCMSIKNMMNVFKRLKYISMPPKRIVKTLLPKK